MRRIGCGLKIAEQRYLCYLVMSQGGQVCFFGGYVVSCGSAHMSDS